MTLIVKNVLDHYQLVLLAKEVCIFTTRNVLMCVHNQLYKVEIHVLTVTLLVSNAHRRLINVPFVFRVCTFMKANAKNALMDGLEMMRVEIVKKKLLTRLLQLL